MTIGEDETCLDCHADLTQGRSVHEPVGEEMCEACHRQTTPEKHAFRPLKNVAKRCQLCHDAHEGEVVHKPVTEGECLSCHDPHHSPTEKLLKADSLVALCGQCHADHLGLGKKAVHGPVAVGACTVCHEAHAAEKPTLLKKMPPDLCLECHDDLRKRIEGATTIHGPVAVGACTQCHDPHATDLTFMLKGEGKALCLSCHEPLARTITSMPVEHGALADESQCLNCHRPHHSVLPKLLERPVAELCLGCHDKPIRRNGDGKELIAMAGKLKAAKFLHGPIQQGECTACHNPHGGDFFSLLHRSYPQTFYSAFSLETYGLCFQCHEARAFTEPETGTLTGFRDGERNLHFVHVNKDRKGRTCRACHDTHASNLPVHLAETVPFGQWNYPINFERTAEGGSCSPGCHVQRSYQH